MAKEETLLKSIEKTVNEGKAVVTADNSVVIAMMQGAFENGRSATFYVAPIIAQAVMRWYWTPQQIKEIGLEPVSIEERKKIESELGAKVGIYFSNRLECGICGHIYGGFEFIEQGIRVHGKGWVNAIMALKNVSVIRINPAQDAICPICNQPLAGGHYYEMRGGPRNDLSYACCGSGSARTLAYNAAPLVGRQKLRVPRRKPPKKPPLARATPPRAT